MKKYLKRLSDGCPLPVFILWWLMRLAMGWALAGSLTADSFNLQNTIHISVCLVASFFWELSLVTGKKSIFSLMPSSIYTFINCGLFLSAFLGVYLNFYYDVRFFDPALQLYFGAVMVFYGFELACAVVKRDRYTATKAMLFFVAFGVFFISLNLWELSEFASDQLLGFFTGDPGNAQFWSTQLSQETARVDVALPAIDAARAPIMDTMNDIIISSIGAFAALIFINIYPYRLKGKYRYNLESDSQGQFKV